MDIETNNKLAGPLVFDESVIRLDAQIREDNDGQRIEDAKVRDFVTSHKDEIFALQGAFFAELREDIADPNEPHGDVCNIRRDGN